MKFAKALMIGAVLAGGAAFAQEEMEPTDPNAIAREELMKSQGMNIGILAKMAGGRRALATKPRPKPPRPCCSKMRARSRQLSRNRGQQTLPGSQARDLGELGRFPREGQGAG